MKDNRKEKRNPILGAEERPGRLSSIVKKVDPETLVIYSAIMHPKFEEDLD